MEDFFGNLARQVLGSQPELGPLLPPRFAAWPGLSLASPLAQAPEPINEPATAEEALFPPPLIAPEHPAVDTPLPTFRQLSQVGTGPGPSIHPDLPSMPEETPETAGAEPGDIGQDAAPPAGTAADGSLPDPAKAVPRADVGQTSQPLPAPPAQPVVEEEYRDAAEAEPGEPGPIPNRPVTPFVPEPVLEPAAAPEPAPVLQPAGPAQGHQAPATSSLQPASHSQPGEPSPGQARPPADAPVTPLVPEPALEPSVAPEPAPVLHRHGTPGAKIPAPPRPAPMPPPAQPVAGQGRIAAPQASVGDQSTAALQGPLSRVGLSPDHDRPKISRRADAAQGDQSPSISPLQPALPYQPGALSPGQARPTESPPLSAEGRPGAPRDQENQRADTPVRPVVQSAPPGPDPVIQRQGTPAVTPNTTPAPEAKAFSPSPGASTVATTPGVHPSPGESALPPALAFRETTIEPLDQLSTAPAAGPGITSGALTFPDQSRPGDARVKPTVDRQPGESGRPGEVPIRPSAKQLGPVAGHGTPLPAEAAPEVTIAPLEPAAPAGGHPPRHRLREAPVDGTAFSTLSEPGIVPALESPSTAGRSTPRTGERAFSRRMPDRPENGQAEPLPTVRVTIGRIEVRTAPPEPPPVAPRPKPVRQTLSLDEYLKAGTGGEP